MRKPKITTAAANIYTEYTAAPTEVSKQLPWYQIGLLLFIVIFTQKALLFNATCSYDDCGFSMQWVLGSTGGDRGIKRVISLPDVWN